MGEGVGEFVFFVEDFGEATEGEAFFARYFGDCTTGWVRGVSFRGGDWDERRLEEELTQGRGCRKGFGGGLST